MALFWAPLQRFGLGSGRSVYLVINIYQALGAQSLQLAWEWGRGRCFQRPFQPFPNEGAGKGATWACRALGRRGQMDSGAESQGEPRGTWTCSSNPTSQAPQECGAAAWMDVPGGRQSSLSVPETVLLLATSSPFQALPSLFKSSFTAPQSCAPWCPGLWGCGPKLGSPPHLPQTPHLQPSCLPASCAFHTRAPFWSLLLPRQCFPAPLHPPPGRGGAASGSLGCPALSSVADLLRWRLLIGMQVGPTGGRSREQSRATRSAAGIGAPLSPGPQGAREPGAGETHHLGAQARLPATTARRAATKGAT